MDEDVTIKLSKAEAIILFELSRHLTAEKRKPQLSEAEQRVLWMIEASLEKILDEPFRADYESVVEQARAIVCEQS